MKFLLTIICASLLFTSSPAQQKETSHIADSAFLQCYYLFTGPANSGAQTSQPDTLVLDIGTRISKFYDPARLGRDSLIRARINNIDPQTIKSVNVYNRDAARDLSGMPGTIASKSTAGESYQIIKNKTDGEITVLDYIDAVGDRFIYHDKVEPLPWTITGVTDTVSSYPCQKATLHFRGRDYVAWFTTDIPASDGPWKFSGLPGLILKVEDTEGLFSFRLIGLQQLTPLVPIVVDDTKNIKCTRAEFEKLKKKQGPGMQVNFNAGNMIIAEIPGEVNHIEMELQ